MATNEAVDGGTFAYSRALTAIGATILVLAAWGAAPAHGDPALAYASYLGGTFDEADVFGAGVASVAVDRFGNVYVAGSTRSADFPTTPGMDETLGGDLDIFITKFSPAGDLVYSTYLGGPCDDYARDIAVDSSGDAYVTGRGNGGFCVEDVPTGALVAKLDEAGNVLYHVILGGTAGDESIGEAIAVGEAGTAYVTGVAQSASHDFPTTDGAYRTQDCGGVGGDVFVAKLTKNPRLSYSTFLCGTGDEVPGGIALDEDGSVYVAGTTSSGDFPLVNPGQDAHHGFPNAVTGFVAKIAWAGDQLLWSTYLGGSQNDYVRDVAIDGARNVYVTGETESADFPTTFGVLQEHAGSRDCPWGTCTDAFVTKIDASGTALAYSTYLYGEGDDGGYGIAVDGAGNATVVGTTTSVFFPIRGALQWELYGLADAFIARVAPDGTRLVYSSFYGGADSGQSPYRGWDRGTSVALDGNGDAYFAGYTWSYDLQTTNDAYQRDLGPGVCDDQGTPCGDTFFGMIVSDGPRQLPPLHVEVAPEEVAPGDTVTATWASLPAPALGDELRLVPVGVRGDDAEVLAWWPTSGEGAGAEPLVLPEWLEPGTYEVRLLSTDPRVGALSVITRSEPFRVVTTTTPPPPPPTCEVAGASVCDDGDPCTDDVCVAGLGCVSTPLEGAASVACTCQRARPATCGRDLVPRALERRKARLCGLVAGGSWSPKRLRAAAKKLDGTMKILVRSFAKGKVSHECADALGADVRDASDRAKRLLAGGGSH
jgi:hypothetical protein